MSEAPRLTASARIALRSFTTGASSTAAARAAADVSSAVASITSMSVSTSSSSSSVRSADICSSAFVSYCRSMTPLRVYSPAITGKTSYRVMNLRSSMTPRFVGSAIATVRTRPFRLRGNTKCVVARSAGINLAILGSTSNFDRSTAGTL